MKEFWYTMFTTWWGITILCVICAVVWITLSALLYRCFFKRFYDIVLSLIAIIVLSPLLLFLTIVGAIVMKGNPYFVQKRPGRRTKLSKKACEKRGVPYGTYGEERIIRLLKFRTMSNAKDSNGNLLPDEKRLNAYGKWLRSTSLDEIPSIFNITFGDISIVGPRPQLIKDMWFMSDEIRNRHNVRPGLTGLAQVNGRNAIGWNKKFEYDLKYIKKISLWRDVGILFKTVVKVFKREDINREGTASDMDYGDWLVKSESISKTQYESVLIRWKKLNKTVWIINHYALTPSQGGLSRHFFFARELQKRGYRVRIFTSSVIHNSAVNMIDKSEKCFFKDVDYEDVHYTYLKSSGYKGNGIARIKNMLGFAFAIKKIWKKYSDEKPDLIYTSTPDLFTAWKSEKFAKRHKLPCAVEIRDLWPLSIVEYEDFSDKNFAIRLLFSLEKKIYRRANALAFTMEGGKDYIREKKWDKQVNLEKVFHINNGIDIVEQNRQREENVLDDADLTDGAFNVIYAGSIRTANCVDLIVKAAQLLQKEQNIRFLIYGDGDKRAELEMFCADNELKNVIFKGKVDKKYIPYICSCAGLNIISVKDTAILQYGVSWNKLFDYMNAKKPILSTVKPNYDLVEKNACGIALSDQSPENIADAILRIYNMPHEEYELMCQNAENGVKDFDYSILTDKFEEVIKYAVEHHGD